MPLKACVGCGRPGPWGKGSRCPRCARPANVHSNPHRGTAAYNRDRLAVFEASGGACHWCGREITLTPGRPDSFELDHVTPRSARRGGADDPSNYVAACRTCNRRRGAHG